MDQKAETHQCPVCKLQYPTDELAKTCEAWCTEHHSCNLEIIKHAIQKTDTE